MSNLKSRATRRAVVLTGVAGFGFATIGAYVMPALADPTPSCQDGDQATAAETEGPYFVPNSPARTDLIEPGMPGRRLEVSGLIMSRHCEPVTRALIEVWQADANGKYDTEGFRLRGHLLSDDDGRYAFSSIVPGLYPGRTRHIHVKVQPPGRPVLTTQLYFPGEARNRADSLFRPDLTLQLVERDSRLAGRFDFVLDLR